MHKRCQQYEALLVQYVGFHLSCLMILIDLLNSGHFGYNQDDIVMLTDDARNSQQVPTRENIVSGSATYVFMI